MELRVRAAAILHRGLQQLSALLEVLADAAAVAVHEREIELRVVVVLRARLLVQRERLGEVHGHALTVLVAHAWRDSETGSGRETQYKSSPK